MSCGPSIFLVMALSQSPAHAGSASSCSRTGTSIISKEYERYSLGMLSVNISFTGLANVLIAGMASISNRFNTAYYTTYRRVSGERRRLSAHALNRPARHPARLRQPAPPSAGDSPPCGANSRQRGNPGYSTTLYSTKGVRPCGVFVPVLGLFITHARYDTKKLCEVQRRSQEPSPSSFYGRIVNSSVPPDMICR